MPIRVGARIYRCVEGFIWVFCSVFAVNIDSS